MPDPSAAPASGSASVPASKSPARPVAPLTAADCRAKAGAALDREAACAEPVMRRHWLGLAKAWVDMAAALERPAAAPAPPPSDGGGQSRP